ncbi:hypothetical protein V6N13_114623 [Hibiscus sabdariffa]
MLKDKSKLQIILLLLHIDIRARFNYTTTWECIWSMTDKAYGYRNMIFSRIDIMTVTYPEPCDVNSVIYAMFLWSKVLPIYAANIWKAIMPDFTHELVNFEQAFKKEIVADNEAILEKLLGGPFVKGALFVLSKSKRKDKVALDDILVVLYIAEMCGNSCESLVAKCIRSCCKSDVDIVTLDKDLPQRIMKQIIDTH